MLMLTLTMHGLLAWPRRDGNVVRREVKATYRHTRDETNRWLDESTMNQMGFPQAFTIG